MDILLQVLQSIGYLFSLVVLVLLWRKALRRSETRQLWIWLAIAWTLNMLGTIAWIVHDLVTVTELNALSVIDLFYASHYVLVGYVLWLYPAPLPRRVWPWIAGTMLVVTVIIWAIYFNPAMALQSGGWTGFLGMAMYPVLDAGIVVLAWSRVRTTRQLVWSRYALLLFCTMASYGIANTINLTEYTFSPISGGILPNIFWILTDVFLLALVLRIDLPKENQRLIRNEE